MKKVKVLIERGDNGTYGAYIEDNNLSYGIIGDGATVQDTINDFYDSYNEMKSYYQEEGKAFEEVKFYFKYDMASFLAYYSDRLSLAGLQRLTGVSQGQLSHYVTGRRKPSAKTVKKIEKSLHDFAKEISQVEFV